MLKQLTTEVLKCNARFSQSFLISTFLWANARFIQSLLLKMLISNVKHHISLIQTRRFHTHAFLLFLHLQVGPSRWSCWKWPPHMILHAVGIHLLSWTVLIVCFLCTDSIGKWNPFVLLHQYTQHLFGIFPCFDSEARVKHNHKLTEARTTCPFLQTAPSVKTQWLIITTEQLIPVGCNMVTTSCVFLCQHDYWYCILFSLPFLKFF